MKIALHNELPGEAQFQQLIDSVSAHSGQSGEFSYESYSHSDRVIAAYDQGRLVGLGRLVDADQSRIEITVLPGYQGREIEGYMRKLLTAHSFCHS
ncbi:MULTISPECIES: GNAT family N-acetyltransferase [Paenibacillus]|uniref:Uncharacterized protein n=1 Tax=Paenibacillus naphthalenovorans TaxID=162209 RepID=A0A0U2W7P3_9BACL|nr:MULTISPECIES: GNAT family N-acetyltransferase [Paenibacillus]ALS23509.1 hypothetical protein IJ22_31390 [Paenibacillus naphthalenovorans]GCL74423.1 N-acetyltransferase [Paenibacillus naphthalenovorans]SDJ03616.1 hypothetical protein SAMN05421868_11577 [Paenibacillus naphthalenovorans]